jgi:hypothetical protein
MQAVPAQPSRRSRGWLRRCLLALAGVYLLLMLPETAPPTPAGAGQQAFAWQRDAFWSSLENEFQQARGKDPALLTTDFQQTLARNWQVLSALPATNLPPSAPLFDQLETNFFLLAPKAAACGPRIPLDIFLQTYAELRRQVKRQSERWPMEARETRARLYRSLYGARAALEETLLQLPPDRVPALVQGDDEPSATPSATVRGVLIHSGDILVSRGGAATSALIARGNDFPGNFSHVALVHVDEATKRVSVIESHIESGVGVSPIEKYLADTKLRIMVLRLRADLPQLAAHPLLPHQAASLAVSNALARHIPYDFTMDYHDPTRLFCSEVASAAYQPLGVTLWMGLSHLSTPGVTSWLAALGARHFETQEPSDLEYDPQLRVVAEWRDPETLFKDHVDNAVIDVMLAAAERGERLGYNPWQLPGARLAKAWSVALNGLGKIGRVPEGMSAATALRVQRLKANHAALAARLREKAAQFKAERGYVPPYWELVRLAREAQKEPFPSAQIR